MVEEQAVISDGQESFRTYVAGRAAALSGSDLLRDERFWMQASEAGVDCFHPRGSDHRPRVVAQLLYDAGSLYLRFRVDDRFVRVTYMRYKDMVCLDSCVEFFVRPRPESGYFNFEVNAGGTLHLSYVTDPRRGPDGAFTAYTMVPPELGGRVRILHSLPQCIAEEIIEPVSWTVAMIIPLSVFEQYVGSLGELAGQQWRCNFYKCADRTSHPHWASWNPIGEVLNFHKPETFGQLRFV